MLNQEQINGKWNEIKGGVRNLWGNITEDELDKVKGDIQSVSGIVQQKYSETKESIREKLDTLMDSFDNETDKSMNLKDGVSSFERNPTGVRTSQKSQIEDAKEDMRTRSPERSQFDKSPNAAINTKQGIAGNEQDDLNQMQKETDEKYSLSGEEDDDEYTGEEIFDDSERENQTYESKIPRH